MLPTEPVWDITVIAKQIFDITQITLCPYHQPSDDSKTHFAHFFIDDKHFSGMWADPINALTRIRRFKGALSPDFSTPWDWPLVDQLFNVRRNRFFGAFWQFHEIPVIPTVSWAMNVVMIFAFLELR